MCIDDSLTVSNPILFLTFKRGNIDLDSRYLGAKKIPPLSILNHYLSIECIGGGGGVWKTDLIAEIALKGLACACVYFSDKGHWQKMHLSLQKGWLWRF